MIKYDFTINSNHYQVEVGALQDGRAQVTVNGTAYDVEIEGGVPASVKPAPKAAAGIGIQSAPAIPVQAAPKAEAQGPGEGQIGIPAPLPGTVTNVLVSKGQKVSKGERVLVLESMKIENDITSPQDGTVCEVLAAKGDSVQEDQMLIIVAIDK